MIIYSFAIVNGLLLSIKTLILNVENEGGERHKS